jgi:RNA polymerase primary sigma factor
MTSTAGSIDAGKKKGYLAYNRVEVNELIPNDVRSPEDLDDVLATIGTLGIDVLERQPGYLPRS